MKLINKSFWLEGEQYNKESKKKRRNDEIRWKWKEILYIYMKDIQKKGEENLDLCWQWFFFVLPIIEFL